MAQVGQEDTHQAEGGTRSRTLRTMIRLTRSYLERMRILRLEEEEQQEQQQETETESDSSEMNVDAEQPATEIQQPPQRKSRLDMTLEEQIAMDNPEQQHAPPQAQAQAHHVRTVENRPRKKRDPKNSTANEAH